MSILNAIINSCIFEKVQGGIFLAFFTLSAVAVHRVTVAELSVFTIQPHRCHARHCYLAGHQHSPLLSVMFWSPPLSH